MARKTPHQCKRPGCPQLVAWGHGAYCNKHKPHDYDINRESAYRRGYDAKWRRIRGKYLQAYSSCADCGAKATEIHHIKPIAQGGTHAWDNLMPLCKGCHSKRTGFA